MHKIFCNIILYVSDKHDGQAYPNQSDCNANL